MSGATTPQNQGLVDLRSDTVTRPSKGMYEAIMSAPVGDDVYGEDETVNLLESRVASLLGKQNALFFSSATQANLAAILIHCGRGEEMISGDKYHVIIDEAGGASALGGVVIQPVAADERGGLCPDLVQSIIKEDDFHSPVSRMLSLENTVSGCVQSLSDQIALVDVARANNLVAHLDGARIMNAVVELGVPPTDITKPFDSVMMCLSKGLGAPAGALLAGEAEFIKRARRLRKMLGGGMRQIGILAACGLYALDHNIDRLAEDHCRAGHLAEQLSQIPGLAVRSATNMLFVEPAPELRADLHRFLAENGVLVGNNTPAYRLVIHLDIDDDDLERVLTVFKGFYNF
ncbi:MAG: threonine aldolase [Gammaproteobacteria bacterium]|jgi:threonine aldolase